MVVNFPANGRVIVEAREEAGKFPQMLFTSERTHQQLLLSSIKDKDKWLIPQEDDSEAARPGLRFRVIDSRGFASPVIMSVGLFFGGSDNGFFLTTFAEVNGKIVRLNQKPFFTNVQGGYYLAYLNKRFSYGLAVWNFIWGPGEPHYTEHKYRIQIYQLRRGKFTQTFQTISRKKYDSDKGANSLRELGISGNDQRSGIPRVKDAIN